MCARRCVGGTWNRRLRSLIRTIGGSGVLGFCGSSCGWVDLWWRGRTPIGPLRVRTVITQACWCMGEPRIIDWFVEICAMGGLVMEGERDSWVWKGRGDWLWSLWRRTERALGLERNKRFLWRKRERERIGFGKEEETRCGGERGFWKGWR